MCALTAPALFDQDDEDGRVIVPNADPVGEDAEDAADAIDLCPAGALGAAEAG